VPVSPHKRNQKGTPDPDFHGTKAPSLPDSRYDLKILQSLRRIIRAVDIHSHKLVSRYKLTTPQLVCLLAVAQKPDKSTTISELARLVYLSPSTVVGILDRLESKKLIRRKRDSHDRRIVNITATIEGIELAEQAPSPLQDSLADGLKKLPTTEQETISSALQRIVDLMEAGDIDAAPILETSRVYPDKNENKSNDK